MGLALRTAADGSLSVVETDEAGAEHEVDPVTGLRAAVLADLRTTVVAARQANRDYLALAAPAAAQTSAQVRALTRQVNGLLALAARQLGS